uniref:Guanine nucleotide-binding protein subunit gamma n=1 Tax=Equus asinus TaxID=9793 RepID=A0A9L0IB54_EQUAS
MERRHWERDGERHRERRRQRHRNGKTKRGTDRHGQRTQRDRPSAMSNNMAKIAEARKTVEQLKLEVNIDRMKVSQAAAELLSFCETHAKDDPLVTPVPAAENPFRDKRLFCVLL